MKSNVSDANRTSASGSLRYGSALPWLVGVILVLLCVVSRLELTAFPNVKPVAALCLLAAFYLRGSWLPCAAMLAVMLVSDWQLGAYAWPVMIGVYASLGLSCVLGSWVRRSVDRQSPNRVSLTGAGPRLVLASLVMSTSFFLLTNGMVWLAGGWYPPTASGLLNCYAAGIPFYRFTLLGDLVFTTGGLVAWQFATAGYRSWVVKPIAA